ncbi:hypothetical protein AAVH_37116, partial [Aphelenchoides avenae]
MPLACNLLLDGLCFYGPLLVVMLATVIMCGGKKKTTSNQAAPAQPAAAASKPPAQSKEAKDKPKEKAAPTPKAEDPADAGTVDGHYED